MFMHANDNSPTLVSLNDAARMTSLSRTMVNRYRAEGRFPSAVPLGDRRVAFVRSEVTDWIQARIDAARSLRAAA
ncbi:MAG: AlpA family phage regulatory protein [Mesorhizobium sp.]|uniref:helix-turn-helix transcriptional regulator n=2 Tax=Mesorhizobium sp. TaxID=1871066 RepID=UPI0011FC7280|nr:MAG: AlpA family phage regulatory protein [Mesorhizobium sp.]TIM39177.1 MAG: AlpA family phage regulatory protein [Mesorhizobium sp.]TIN37611.1 MAG: AlpA family phage regulatory protein [Mesorhizobium sp.]